MYQLVKDKAIQELTHEVIYNGDIPTVIVRGIGRWGQASEWEEAFESEYHHNSKLLSTFIKIMNIYGMKLESKVSLKCIDHSNSLQNRTLKYVDYNGKQANLVITFDKVFGFIRKEYKQWTVIKINGVGFYETHGIYLSKLFALFLIDPLEYMKRVDIRVSAFLKTFEKCINDKIYGGANKFWVLNDIVDQRILVEDITKITKEIMALLYCAMV